MGKVDTGKTETIEEPQPAAVLARRPPELSDVHLPPRFTPRRVLGAGAMGYVVEARDESLGRDVAVKVISARRVGDARSRERFLREARAFAALHHENIVTIHDLDPRGHFIVMELVRGDTLRMRIERDKQLAPAEVRRIGAALLDALATAHAAGFVHRDVKPANVLLGDDGSVKLADFGIAATTDSELTATGELLGTPAYMAPEQLRGHGNDPRADIYATGATLFEAATGERLHVGRERTEDPRVRILASVPDRALAEAIARAVREKPGERYANVGEFARALAARVPPHRHLRMRLVAGGAVAVIAGIGTAVAMRSHEKPDELALGVAALERHELTAAEQHLAKAPDDARTQYYRALVGWWTQRPTDEVKGELDRAIAGGLDERSSAIARGVRELVELEYPGVVETFRTLRMKYPDDRYVLYGEFEALFHCGRPDDALDVFHHLREVAPHFGLGANHALTFYLAKGDVESARWALAGTSGTEHVRWQARVDAAADDVAAAKRGLDKARAAATGTDADTLGWDRVALDAQTGDVEHAHALALELATKNLQAGAVPLYGLALARGVTDGADGSQHLAGVALDAARLPPSILVSTRDAWLELATFSVIDGDVARARTALAALPTSVDDKMLEVALARVLLSALVGDDGAVARFFPSAFPPVRAAAEALAAERSNDPRAAAAAWARALSSEGFGRFHIALALRLARAHAKAGDARTAAEVCASIIHPTLFHWSWAAAVGECRQLTAARTPP
ncbi:MAG TPA: serine/threonine-protein kinase [Kofleriaceae bacterium]|nr:serine/threonine-protein kinase [Kofleriaceae bacterium]